MTGAVRLYMAMSLDGFIAGPDDDHGNGLGTGGEVLHDWLRDGDVHPRSHRPTEGANAQVFDEAMSTGAVITGRRTFELADAWAGDHHDAVPIFVLTRAPRSEPAPGHARWVTDLEACVTEARAKARGRDVMVHGAAAAQSLLSAGLLDELELHVVAVLLGKGRRLFDGVPAEVVELEPVRVLEGVGALHLRYRVRTEG